MRSKHTHAHLERKEKSDFFLQFFKFKRETKRKIAPKTKINFQLTIKLKMKTKKTCSSS